MRKSHLVTIARNGQQHRSCMRHDARPGPLSLNTTTKRELTDLEDTMVSRKTGWVALFAVSALTLGGCAQGSTVDNTEITYDSSATIEEAQLTVMGFAEPDEIGQTRWDLAAKSIAPATIKPSDSGFDIQAFLAANSAGNSPDLIYIERNRIGSLASLGAVMPLDSCITGEEIKTEDFNKPSLAQSQFNDKTYGLPEFNQVQLTMANADLLSAAGLTYSDVDGSDWGKLTAAAPALAKVSDGGALEVIGVDPKIPEFFPLWAKANGVDLISDDGRTANLNDPKAVEALTYAVSLLEPSGGWAKVKSLRDSADFFGEANQFAANDLGSMWMEQWYVNVLNEMTPDLSISITPVISKTTGDPIAMATGSAWAIPTKAKNKAAACRFIKTMTESDSWMAAAQARVDKRTAAGLPFTGLLTANTVADNEIKEKFVKPTGSEVWDTAIASTYKANDFLFYMPSNPADQEFKQAWMDASNRVLAGQMTPQESLDQAQTEAQAALDAAWAKLDG